MHPLWLWLVIALATPLPTPVATGFDRVWADLDTLALTPEEAVTAPDGALVLHNGHTTRATVTLGDVAIGQHLPMQTATLQPVPAGKYIVKWTLPGGVERKEAVGTEAIDAPQ
jgi:hypothetical protein